MSEKQEQDQQEFDKLEKSVSLLRRLILGHRAKDNCQCAVCDTRKFLDEII